MKKKENFLKKHRSQLYKFHLKGRRALVRIDGNVPLEETCIVNDYRLQATLPTLRYIQEHGGTIVLITHLGRPKKPTSKLSTKLLQPWFEQNGFTVTFAVDIETAYKQSLEKKYDIILLENIRFFQGEKNQDPNFARSLSRLGEYYVNDAFASLHRNDTSITLVPHEFSPEHKTIGLLVEKELQNLSALLDHQQRPFVVILGGGKPETKMCVIQNFLGFADIIMIYPAIVFTFNKALGKEVGKSLVDLSLIDEAKTILQQSSLSTTKLIFPTDYQVLSKRINGNIITIDEDQFPQDGIGASLGPKSLAQAKEIIEQAGTIFFNCAMGFSERKETLQESFALLQGIADSNAFSIIAGGNSVDLAFKLGNADKYDYLSTGGGATLYYISGRALPGLKACEFG